MRANEVGAPSTSIQQRAFTIPEFCEAYRLGRTLAYEEMRSGRLKSFRVGGRRLISSEAAENWRRSLEAEVA